jgi:hypothetical protein
MYNVLLGLGNNYENIVRKMVLFELALNIVKTFFNLKEKQPQNAKEKD